MKDFIAGIMNLVFTLIILAIGVAILAATDHTPIYKHRRICIGQRLVPDLRKYEALPGKKEIVINMGNQPDGTPVGIAVEVM